MDTKLHSFLNSNLLHKYLVGETSNEETQEVQFFINNYPEAAEAYKKLQGNLELVAKAGAVDVPFHVFENITEALENSNDTKVIQLVQHKKTSWYSIAATAAAVLFAVSTFFLYQKNQNLLDENNVVIDEIFDLRSDIEKNNAKLDELSKELTKLNDPDAIKYVMSGNDRAKDLKTVAYINPVDKTSMIDIIKLPELPEDQHYQIWAELQDRMVNLGILDESERTLKQIPYMEDALALSIKIGKDGDDTNENNTEVAEISLKE